MSTLIQVLVISLAVGGSSGKRGKVGAVPWASWLEQVINHHLTLLSIELYADSFQKMKNIAEGATRYDQGASYMIGNIASSIYGLFNRMLVIYKDITKLSKYKHRNLDDGQSLKDPLLAFGVCQSIYHQIRLEKKMFEDVMRDYSKRDREQLAKFKNKHKLKGEGPQHINKHLFKGGMNVERRRNIDDLFNEDDFDSNFQIPILSKKKENIYTPKKTNEKNAFNTSVPCTPRNYAPPPIGKLMPKLNNPLAYTISHISRHLPVNVPKISNPIVQKLMSQLKRDNPQLNPDLDFMRGNYQHENTDEDFDMAEAKNAGRSSINRNRNIDKKLESLTSNGHRSGSNGYDIHRSKLKSNNDRIQSRRKNTNIEEDGVRSKSNPRRSQSDSFQTKSALNQGIQSRRMESDFPEVRQQSSKINRPRRSSRNQPQRFDTKGSVDKGSKSRDGDSSSYVDRWRSVINQQRTKKKNISPRWKPKIL